MLSAPEFSICPSDVEAEVAVFGRSNVGKSTLLGALLQHASLVRTSRTPGRTQALNYFKDNQGRVFVDVPGYGYADVPETIARGMVRLMATYVDQRDALSGLLLLLDARRDKPSEDDFLWLEKFQNSGRPYFVVITKIDRIPKAKQKPLIKQLTQALELDPKLVLACSAESGQGMDEVRRAVDSLFR